MINTANDPRRRGWSDQGTGFREITRGGDSRWLGLWDHTHPEVLQIRGPGYLEVFYGDTPIINWIVFFEWLNGQSENKMDNLGVFHSRRPPFVEVTKYRGCQWPVAARYIKRFGVHPVHGGKLEVKDLVPLWGCWGADWWLCEGPIFGQRINAGGIYIYIYNQWGLYI